MIQLLVIILLLLGALTLSGTTNEASPELEPTQYSNVDALPGLTMTVVAETINPTGVTVLFENEMDTEFTYGQEYVLETQIDGKWYQVPIATGVDYAFESIGYILAPNESAELAVDWEWLFGEIDSGEYRIVKEILDVAAPGDYESFPLSAEFLVE